MKYNKKVYRFLSNRSIAFKEINFKQIAEKLGIDFNFIYYDDLFYVSWKWLFHISKGNIENVNGVWITGNDYLDFKRAISYLYSEILNIEKVIDTRNKKMLDDSKLSQIIMLDKKGYNIPKSVFFYVNKKFINILKNEISFPIIAKDINLDRWEWVFLINNEAELNNFFEENNNKPILFQEFVKNNGDWRVVVVWNKVIWGFKRVNFKDFKNNYSQGGKVIFEEVPEILTDIAINVCKDFEIQIWGIDFFYNNNQYWVIEINRTPQTNAFRKKYWNLYEQEVLKLFI